jgi:hypothetical protein
MFEQIPDITAALIRQAENGLMKICRAGPKPAYPRAVETVVKAEKNQILIKG